MADLTKHATMARLGKHEERPITRENVLAELREAARAPGSPIYAIRAVERAVNLIGRLSELVDAAETERRSAPKDAAPASTAEAAHVTAVVWSPPDANGLHRGRCGRCGAEWSDVRYTSELAAAHDRAEGHDRAPAPAARTATTGPVRGTVCATCRGDGTALCHAVVAIPALKPSEVGEREWLRLVEQAARAWAAKHGTHHAPMDGAAADGDEPTITPADVLELIDRLRAARSPRIDELLHSREGGAVKRIPFNLNDHVWVKLTERGKAIYVQHYAFLPIHVRPPEPDERGFVKFQLWNLMEIFGPHVGTTLPLSFETEMEIEVRS